MQVVAENSGERVDVFLARMLPELTRSAVARLLEQNAVTCNGAPVKKNAKTLGGACYELTLPELEQYSHPRQWVDVCKLPE